MLTTQAPCGEAVHAVRSCRFMGCLSLAWYLCHRHPLLFLAQEVRQGWYAASMEPGDGA